MISYIIGIYGLNVEWKRKNNGPLYCCILTGCNTDARVNCCVYVSVGVSGVGLRFVGIKERKCEVSFDERCVK